MPVFIFFTFLMAKPNFFILRCYKCLHFFRIGASWHSLFCHFILAHSSWRELYLVEVVFTRELPMRITHLLSFVNGGISCVEILLQGGKKYIFLHIVVPCLADQFQFFNQLEQRNCCHRKSYSQFLLKYIEKMPRQYVAFIFVNIMKCIRYKYLYYIRSINYRGYTSTFTVLMQL